MNICKCEWCEDISKFKGYCKRHYGQMNRWGECRFSRGDKNEYVILTDYAEIILYNKELKEKARAIIDIEDVDKCKDYKWSIRTDGYVSTRTNGTALKLHRFLLSTQKGMHVDHINRNKLDNRKYNLKECSQSENNKNKGKYKTNSSGHVGVSKVMSNKEKYTSEIRVNGKNHYLGTFYKFEDAVRARQEAEIKYHGKIISL